MTRSIHRHKITKASSPEEAVNIITALEKAALQLVAFVVLHTSDHYDVVAAGRKLTLAEVQKLKQLAQDVVRDKESTD